MSVSPDGKFLALFTSAGNLWVVSTDFQKSLSEYETGSSVPQQLVWYVVNQEQVINLIYPFSYSNLTLLCVSPLGVVPTRSFSTGTNWSLYLVHLVATMSKCGYVWIWRLVTCLPVILLTPSS